MAQTASTQRPALQQKDTLDAPRLIGNLTDDGTASLQESHDPLIPNGGTTHDGGRVVDSASPAMSDSAWDQEGEDAYEDYDKIEIDPDTLVSNSRMSLDESMRPSGPSDFSALNEAQRQLSGTGASIKAGKRRSIQIRLEKTGRKGRYTIKADDPDVREILRKGMERQEQEANSAKKSRLRIRDLVFTRQFTTFDRQNPASAESPFFGFFTLFWLAMVLMFVQVSMHNWRVYGSILGNQQIIRMMFGRDVLVLGAADALMCASTGVTVVIQLAVQGGYLSWAKYGWVVQNLWQTCFLGTVIWLTWFRDWPWTHTIFIVLHALVFLMKQHSFAFYNGYLSGVQRRRTLLEQKLKQLERIEQIGSPPTSPTSPASPAGPTYGHGISASLDLGKVGETNNQSLPSRRRSMGPRTSTNLHIEKSDVASVAKAIESGQPLDLAQVQAFAEVIKSEIADLTNELQGKSNKSTKAYPHNLSVTNFAEFICLPTLVYELEYPRQERINWWYVLEKTTATFGVLCVMMVISQAFIYPPVVKTVQMKEAGVPFDERVREFPFIVSDMLFPLLIEQILTWYVIWECILNVLAELTYFADRGFYGDWWNSVSWDQYAREWNRPVHHFLLRHVYHSTISSFHLSKHSATFVTFLLSALVHEMCMAVMFKKVRLYLFIMQLLQVPLVSLSQSKFLKGRTVLGNTIFWLGLFVGPAFLTSLYLIL